MFVCFSALEDNAGFLLARVGYWYLRMYRISGSYPVIRLSGFGSVSRISGYPAKSLSGTSLQWYLMPSDLWPWPPAGRRALVPRGVAPGGGGAPAGARGRLPGEGEHPQRWEAGGAVCVLGLSQALYCTDNQRGEQ